MAGHSEFFNHFIRRLNEGISRSALLRVVISKTGRLVDVASLADVRNDLPGRVLESIIDGGPSVNINFDLRTPLFEDDDDDMQESFLDPIERAEKKRDAALLALYHKLSRHLPRHAELVRRETGVHTLWLGYPLLYATAPGVEEKWMLAPLLLWPIEIKADLRKEGRVRVQRVEEAGAPQFNMVLAGWLKRVLDTELPEPTEDQLSSLDEQKLCEMIDGMASSFQHAQQIDWAEDLRSVPRFTELGGRDEPMFIRAAVVGYFRWQNQNILKDLTLLSDWQYCEGPLDHLLSGRQRPDEPPLAPPPESDRYLVCDTDFSQERAVWQARRGPGQVVHGPPGTGKSQTIVNIIADSLAHGQRVLMVCQKQAATHVVLERLRQAQLDDLCIEVHDAGADRQKIFRALREQVDQLPTEARPGNSHARTDIARRIEQTEKELDAHASALHEVHFQIGRSYRQILSDQGRLFAQMSSVRAIDELFSIIESINADELNDLIDHITLLGNLYGVARPLENAWKDRREGVAQSSLTLRRDLEEALRPIREADAHHLRHIEESGAGVDLPDDLNGYADAADEAHRLLGGLLDSTHDERTARATRNWIIQFAEQADDAPDLLRDRIKDLKYIVERASNIPDDPVWHTAFTALNPDAAEQLLSAVSVLDKHRSRWFRVFDGHYRQAKSILYMRRPDARGNVFWPVVDAFIRYHEKRQLLHQLRNECADLLPRFALEEETSDGLVRSGRWVTAGFDLAYWMLRDRREQPWVRRVVEWFAQDQPIDRLRLLLKDLDIARLRIEPLRQLFGSLETLNTLIDMSGAAALRQLALAGESVAPWIDQVKADLDVLDSLCAYEYEVQQSQGRVAEILRSLEEYESTRRRNNALPQPADSVSDDRYGDWWSALVRFAVYQHWIIRCETDHPILLRITPEVHESKRNHLKELLVQKRQMEADAIRSLWQAKQIEHRGEPWKVMFKLRAGRHGPAKRLREAMNMARNRGLFDMRPCWLVNPEMAAQLFSLEEGLFDIVIFDEASQCPFEQAVPAIYRGKRLVVAGDEKQLPPTSFFAAQVQWDDENPPGEEQDEEASDTPVDQYERKLKVEMAGHLIGAQDLLEASIPTMVESWLSVHYRSRHPELIEFSNQAFYEGRLEMPPSPSQVVDGSRPIVYHAIEGTYDRRTNHDEANYVLEILRDYWLERESNHTIGIVTFNQPQRELILDVIASECQRDPQFARRYESEELRLDDNQDVGFFVKNLENVQGDERDVMIFSTTFGCNPQGQFYRLFGPVGKDGGERRLNVATTRAKHRVIVVGSMPLTKIASALTAVDAPGEGLTPSGYLQLYLSYATAVSQNNKDSVKSVLRRLKNRASAAPVGQGVESFFEQEVLDALQSEGHTVHTQIGEEGFRIDLAVVDPEDPTRYLLGIECDGATYHSDRSARIRDVWRQQVLVSRGWHIHRIWSTRWWRDPHQELELVLRSLEKRLVSHRRQRQEAPDG